MAQEKQSCDYEVVSIAFHDGEDPHQGHYYNISKNIIDKKWYYYNNNNVLEVKPSQFVNQHNKKAYLILMQNICELDERKHV